MQDGRTKGPNAETPGGAPAGAARCPEHRKVAARPLVKAHARAAGSVPSGGCAGCVSLPPPFLSSKNQLKNILKNQANENPGMVISFT